jgi:hypothetical protein
MPIGLPRPARWRDNEPRRSHFRNSYVTKVGPYEFVKIDLHVNVDLDKGRRINVRGSAAGLAIAYSFGFDHRKNPVQAGC